MLIEAQRSGLLIVDVQGNLLPVMSDPRRVLRGCGLLLRAAVRLGLPLAVSEQYPKGLGPTSAELWEALPDPEPARAKVMEKIHFSCAAEPTVREEVERWGRERVVIAGIEAHVCVLQTALGFKKTGLEPVVVADACASRDPANHQAAMARLAANGVEVATTEMVIFEWLHRAATPEFRELSALIK